MVPLTPNLKYSDPFNSRMYDDKHIYKRSNSQNEFDFLTNIGPGGFGNGTFDFN